MDTENNKSVLPRFYRLTIYNLLATGVLWVVVFMMFFHMTTVGNKREEWQTMAICELQTKVGMLEGQVGLIPRDSTMNHMVLTKDDLKNLSERISHIERMLKEMKQEK